jgi:hypothetical protein
MGVFENAYEAREFVLSRFPNAKLECGAKHEPGYSIRSGDICLVSNAHDKWLAWIAAAEGIVARDVESNG